MFRLLSILFCISLSVNVFSQVSFTGYLVNEGDEKLKDVSVLLYQGNDLISTQKWSKKFEYDLDMEKYYTMELVKDGFITKRIAISTFEGDKGAEPFMFVMELFEKRDGVDESELDFPSAIIEYKKNKGVFSFNVPYSKNIKKEQNEALKSATN